MARMPQGGGGACFATLPLVTEIHLIPLLFEPWVDGSRLAMAHWTRLALAGMISATAGNALANDKKPPVAAGDLIIGALARPSDGGRWMLRQVEGRYIAGCSG